MTTHFRVAGTWEELVQPSVRVAGVWEDCVSVHVKVGGSWQEVWVPVGGDSAKLDTWNLSDTNLGKLTTCGVAFQTDGSINRIGDTGTILSDNWWTGNPSASIGDDYEVGFTAIQAGHSWTQAAATINNFVQLNAQRIWNVRLTNKASPGTKAANAVTFVIRTYPGSVVVATSTLNTHSCTN